MIRNTLQPRLYTYYLSNFTIQISKQSTRLLDDEMTHKMRSFYVTNTLYPEKKG